MHAFLELIDLAARRVGGAVVFANDEFFGPKERLLLAAKPRWVEGKYTERGKWMDGWETRRRREPGHDWCVVRLGIPGTIHGFIVDTTHFVGNHPEACSAEGCALDGPVAPEVWGDVADDRAGWIEILPRTALAGNTENLFAVTPGPRVTHVRFTIYPDGGVARLRVYGRGVPDRQHLSRREPIDLAAAAHGGLVVASSDMFFGSRQNIILPGTGATIGEGWETKRRRDGGHDWVIVQLATAGRVTRAEVDTTHFIGNAPARCSMDRAVAASTAEALSPDLRWEALLPDTPLQPDTVHRFERELRPGGAATHVRLNIYPDGGINRLRLYGVAES